MSIQCKSSLQHSYPSFLCCELNSDVEEMHVINNACYFLKDFFLMLLSLTQDLTNCWV